VDGQIDEAYEKYVSFRGEHHNPFFPRGFRALQKAMIEDHARFPSKKLMVKNVLGDGDMVAVHSHLVMRTGESGMAVVHLFRFRADKIVEMWDCAQLLPPDSPNKDGAF
jgi:predicted SnoaL-like aldol condensation-catalyzing enzyme